MCLPPWHVSCHTRSAILESRGSSKVTLMAWGRAVGDRGWQHSQELSKTFWAILVSQMSQLRQPGTTATIHALDFCNSVRFLTCTIMFSNSALHIKTAIMFGLVSPPEIYTESACRGSWNLGSHLWLWQEFHKWKRWRADMHGCEAPADQNVLSNTQLQRCLSLPSTPLPTTCCSNLCISVIRSLNPSSQPCRLSGSIRWSCSACSCISLWFHDFHDW